MESARELNTRCRCDLCTMKTAIYKYAVLRLYTYPCTSTLTLFGAYHDTWTLFVPLELPLDIPLVLVADADR